MHDGGNISVGKNFLNEFYKLNHKVRQRYKYSDETKVLLNVPKFILKTQKFCWQ